MAINNISELIMRFLILFSLLNLAFSETTAHEIVCSEISLADYLEDALDEEDENDIIPFIWE